MIFILSRKENLVDFSWQSAKIANMTLKYLTQWLATHKIYILSSVKKDNEKTCRVLTQIYIVLSSAVLLWPTLSQKYCKKQYANQLYFYSLICLCLQPVLNYMLKYEQNLGTDFFATSGSEMYEESQELPNWKCIPQKHSIKHWSFFTDLRGNTSRFLSPRAMRSQGTGTV